MMIQYHEWWSNIMNDDPHRSVIAEQKIKLWGSISRGIFSKIVWDQMWITTFGSHSFEVWQDGDWRHKFMVEWNLIFLRKFMIQYFCILFLTWVNFHPIRNLQYQLSKNLPLYQTLSKCKSNVVINIWVSYYSLKNTSANGTS